MKKRIKSGIDINLGNKCSAIAYQWAKKTFVNRKNKTGKPIESVDGTFSGIIDIKGNRIGISSDGIGTKVELAERTGIYDTIAFDLIAMVVDDLAANGFEACSLSNILDVDLLDKAIVDELMQGIYNAANVANICISGGEIAELGERISGYGNKMHFNWCATGFGILAECLSEPIAGNEIKEDDVVISLQSKGYRSNGFSLIRNIMEENLGREWHNKKYLQNKTWGEILLTPSLIFTPFVNSLLDNKIIPNGIVHVTGGGVPDNIRRVLKPTGLGAKLDNLFSPHEFMLKLQKMGNVEEKQAYKLWNMGNGMLFIVKKSLVQKLFELTKNSDYQLQIAGKINSNNKIEINSKGNEPQKLVYER